MRRSSTGRWTVSARLDAEQQDRRYRIFSTVTNQRFQGGRPDPPDWLWHEIPDTRRSTLIPIGLCA